MSSDACFMGMPSRVGPVAILGLWAAMLDAALVGPLVASNFRVLVSSVPEVSDWGVAMLMFSRLAQPRREDVVVGDAKGTVPGRH